MSNPFDDKMNHIAQLRNRAKLLTSQLDDEIAKAWRLAPVQNLTVFARTLGMTEDEVHAVLTARGINASS